MEGLQIKNFMSKDVLVVGQEESVLSAAKKMASRDIGSIVVIDGNEKPVGIFTERDILVRVVLPRRDYVCTKISEVMTKNPVMIKENDTYLAACDIIRKNDIRHLPVVNEKGKLMGMLSIKDLSGYVKKDR